MYLESLSGDWQFRQVLEDSVWLPIQVPGGVHTALMAAGVIPDPFVADNEKRVMWVAESDWEFHRTFVVSPELLAQDRVFLICDGLDTLAQVWINGQLIGQTTNMFRQYRWEIKSLLLEGENEINISFASAVQRAIDGMDERPLPGASEAIPGSAYVRKAPSQYGWDWGPMLPPVGIWKDICLKGYSVAHLDDVYLGQAHTEDSVTLSAQVTVEKWQARDLVAELHVTAPDGRVWTTQETLENGQVTISMLLSDPQLWWPNGYGQQPLYQIEVSLLDGEHLLDRHAKKIGLRTLVLDRHPDEWGESFTFVVNGVPIFAKGSNWIPADSFPTRIEDVFLEHLIASAAETHQNMLRVWGGGFYEEERFYDLCDHYGILVWQDFIFACGIYPLDDPAFVENIRVEVVQNVKRLRHRASLALWCGNNEMEWGWANWGWSHPGHKDLKEAYDRFFHRLLPNWLEMLDPDHSYWPSSPSSGIPFDDPNAQDRGDAHYWDVWHGRRPFTAYRGQYPRFMSEFGFQSLPPLPTIATYADEADWNMTSYLMEYHQRGNHGNGLIMGQMTDTLRMPKDFPSLVYLSMVLQAEGIRYGVEHWRRSMNRVSGTLYWQLNDCWPVASWSSIDSFGRWKALHYAARRFYAPLHLSVEDQQAVMGVHVTSDLIEVWDGELRWSLEALDGTVLEEGIEPVRAAALADTKVMTIDFSDRDFAADLVPSRTWQVQDRKGVLHTFAESTESYTSRDVVFVCELWCKGERKALLVTPFVASKHLELNDPGLMVLIRLEGETLIFDLTARSLARFVELALEGADEVFSDNYFDLPAGRTVTVTCPLPADWTLSQAQEALHVRSLYDSFT